MACTTILVGKRATNDGSTMIARNDDSGTGYFNAKKLVLAEPDKQPRKYKSVISHVQVELPDNPLRYTCMPNVDSKEGKWLAAGINEANVSMTATETITTNPRVLGADPLVKLIKARGNKREIPGGIGEEDLVLLVLPYIHSAKEGAMRLGSLLEKYGTYECNGIAFSDINEIWWLESIGGHHWIAKKVPDDCYVTMPNQFGLDTFDLEEAFSSGKENLCSADLREFIKENSLDLNPDGKFNPRLAFGSHSDSDHVYNTPRAWFIERYFNPRSNRWEGDNADYTPLSDDIPWCRKPERLITVEDVKYVLSSHYQGTMYDPYARFGDNSNKGAYRPIGISRTSFVSLTQLRPNLPKEIAAIEYFAFGSNVFNAFIPIYTNVHKIPPYFNNTTLKVSTDNFYWSNRLIGALADSHFNFCSAHIERYQDTMASKAHKIISDFDKEYMKKKDLSVLEKANADLAEMAKEETDKVLDKVLYEVSCHMKNGYSKSDN